MGVLAYPAETEVDALTSSEVPWTWTLSRRLVCQHLDFFRWLQTDKRWQ